MYFAAHRTKESIGPKVNNEVQNNTGFNINDYKAQALAQLDSSSVKIHELLEQGFSNLNTVEEKSEGYYQMASFWEMRGYSGLSAENYKSIALINDTSASIWSITGLKYLESSQMSTDSASTKYWNSKAIECIERALELDPKNLDYNADKIYAQVISANGAPMKWIGELLAQNNSYPQHRKTTYYLGLLAIRSGQYEKAIARFEIMVKDNPTDYQAAFGLAQAYQEMGDIKNAINTLQDLKAVSKDGDLITQIEQIISQLNT